MQESEIVSVAKTYDNHHIYLFIKRLFDIVVSLSMLIILSPLLLLVILAIRIESKGNAIFVQERIGKGGKLFKFYKFRSMVNNADEILDDILKNDEQMANEYRLNKKLANDPRITKVGKFIRRTSIDELPQLVNVLKGDMAMIGNRPYLPREIEDMGGFYKQIIMSKPGITGYWQTSGRSKTTFKARCQMEAEYSKNMSLHLDIKIFFKTFLVLLNRDGAE